MDGGGELREVCVEVLGGRETCTGGGARPGDREEGAGDEGRVGAGGVDDAVEEARGRVGEGGGEGSDEEPVDEHDKTCCARRHTAASGRTPAPANHSTPAQAAPGITAPASLAAMRCGRTVTKHPHLVWHDASTPPTPPTRLG